MNRISVGDLVDAARRLVTTTLNLELMRFLVVGGLNFVLTFVLFFVSFRLLHIHHLVALTLASVVGMVFTYALNFTWVFKPEEQLKFQQRFAKYLTANVTSLVLNLVVLHTIVELTSYDPFYVQCALIPLIVIFNFLTAKYWSLRPKT